MQCSTGKQKEEKNSRLRKSRKILMWTEGNHTVLFYESPTPSTFLKILKPKHQSKISIPENVQWGKGKISWRLWKINIKQLHNWKS